MEETKTNVPTPPQGLRKMPPPPPKPQGVGQNSPVQQEQTVEKVEKIEEPVKEPQKEPQVEVVEEKNDIEQEKPKKEKKSKTGFLYWSGFFLSLALIAFCIFMLF